MQQLFHEQSKRKPEEDFEFSRNSESVLMGDKLGEGSGIFNPLMLHSASTQFLPSSSFTAPANAKLQALASHLNFSHLDHHGDLSSQSIGPRTDASKLPAKPEWAHPINQMFNSFNSAPPPPPHQTDCVDPNTVFSPLQIQTLRYLFRATIDEYLFNKNGVLMSPLMGLNSSRSSFPRPPSDGARSDDDGDDGSITLTAAEKKLVRHTIEERWPDGSFPCPKDVKYTDLNELAHAAAVKIVATKTVDNPALLKSKIKKQINRALTNKRRHLAIKSNPDMREKVVNKMKRFRQKVKEGEKRVEHKDGDSRLHSSLLSLGSGGWGQPGGHSSVGSSHPMLPVPPSHLTNHSSYLNPFSAAHGSLSGHPLTH